MHPILGRIEFHNGLDIPGWTGAPVRASASGRVTTVGWSGGYGQMITLDHGNGYKTIYAHLSKYKVNIGDNVTKGQLIGLCGSTGLSTGPHLHYEVRYRNKPINPVSFLNVDIFSVNSARIKSIRSI